MNKIEFENCGNQFPLINKLNFTVLPHYYKEKTETDIRIVIPLLVYCANCGKTQHFTIVHYFNSLYFDNKTEEELVLLTLNSQHIMQVENYFSNLWR